MNYLLDTHVLLWAVTDTTSLSPTAFEILIDRSNEILVSSISLWEISLKFSLGKLQLDNLEPERLPQLIEEIGFSILELSPEDAATYHRLSPQQNHKDPFDRMLIWQAINHHLTVISKDERFKQYQQVGLIVKW